MAWIRTGTVSVVNGSPIITGTGTLWASTEQVFAGEQLIVSNKVFEIASIQSNTQLTLVSAYSGPTDSNLNYVIWHSDSIGSVSVTNNSTIVIGSNTLWQTNNTFNVGDYIGISNKLYTVASVDSNTQLTLNYAYTGTSQSGLSYSVQRQAYSGTISVNNNSLDVYGTGTYWDSTQQVYLNDLFIIGNKIFSVAAIVSDTHIQLNENYTGSNLIASSYRVIHPLATDQELSKSIAKIAAEYYTTVAQLIEWETTTEPTVTFTNPITNQTYNVKSLSSVGSNVWREGSGIPSSSLGANGDYYIDLLQADVYKKSSGAYSKILSLKGTGNVWYVDSGIPSNNLGGQNDFYLRSDTGTIYRKTAPSGLNSWSLVGTLYGTGSGNTLRHGTGSPSSTVGVEGDYYLKTSSGALYQKVNGDYAYVINIAYASTSNSGSYKYMFANWFGLVYNDTGYSKRKLPYAITVNEMYLWCSGTAMGDTKVILKADGVPTIVGKIAAGQSEGNSLFRRDTVVDVPGDPNFSSVRLLCHMEDASGSTAFSDLLQHSFSRSVGTGAITNAVKKFGNSSYLFNNDTYVTTADNTDFSFTNGNFTIELYVYPLVIPAYNAYAGLITKRSAENSLNSYALYINGNTKKFEFMYTTDGSTFKGATTDNTESILHFEGNDNQTTIWDERFLSWYVGGNAKIMTTEKKFGNSSLYLDGTGDYAYTSISALGTTDWCIEGWIFPLTGGQTAGHTFSRIMSIGNNAGQTTVTINVVSNGNPAQLYAETYWATSGGWTALSSASTAIANNTWHHVALSRKSGKFYFFVNGTLIATTNSNNDAMSMTGTTLYVGGDNYGNNFYGYIDEFRFTRGHYRYDQSFSVPTEPFTFNSSDKRLFSSTTAAINTWYHIAIVRNAQNMSMFVNGVEEMNHNCADNSIYTSTSVLGFGRRDVGSASNYFSGYMDEIRFSKGFARYGGNFTVSTKRFADSTANTYMYSDVAIPNQTYQIAANTNLTLDVEGTGVSELALRISYI